MTLLLPALLFAQTSSPAPTRQSASPAASSGSCPVMSAAAKARARQVFGYFESGQSAQLFAAFSPPMKKASTSAKVTTMAKEVTSKWGSEEKMLGENFAPDLLSKNTVYSRFSQFAKSKQPVFTAIIIDEQGQVALIQPRPIPQAPGN